MGDMPCDVCGSFQHEDHPSCSYCGSDRHVEHPVCSICGSYEHEQHPRCGYCGSYDHAAHPRCGYCGSYDHEQHPRCPVCSSSAHTEHEEVYLTNGDIGAYWATLRVFANKLGVLLEELERGSAWTLIEADAFFGTKPQEQVTEEWAVGLQCTTNTLAALLKVPLHFNPVLERPLKRETLNREYGDGHERLRLARNLLILARGLLSDFDAISAQVATAHVSGPAE